MDTVTGTGTDTGTNNYENLVTCKHFPITENESYVEFSTQMSQLQYDEITATSKGKLKKISEEPGKNKILI